VGIPFLRETPGAATLPGLSPPHGTLCNMHVLTWRLYSAERGAASLCHAARSPAPSPTSAGMQDLLRKQHATRSGEGNGDVSVSVRVRPALRRASDRRRGQNTVFCLFLTKQATKATGDARRGTLLALRYLNMFLSYSFSLCFIFLLQIYINMYIRKRIYL